MLRLPVVTQIFQEMKLEESCVCRVLLNVSTSVVCCRLPRLYVVHEALVL